MVARGARPDAPLFPPMSNEYPSRGWMTRNVVVLSGVSFLQDAASELLYPILPIFLTVQLGAPVAVVGILPGGAGSRRSRQGRHRVCQRLASGNGRTRHRSPGQGRAGSATGCATHGRSRAGDARTDLWFAPCRRYYWRRSRSASGARRVRTVEQQGRPSPAVSHRSGARGPLGSTHRGGARVATTCRKENDKGTAHGDHGESPAPVLADDRHSHRVLVAQLSR